MIEDGGRGTVVKWLEGTQPIIMTPEIRSRLEELQGFGIFDVIIPAAPRVPFGQPLIHYILSHHPVAANDENTPQIINAVEPVSPPLPPTLHPWAQPALAPDESGDDEIQFMGLPTRENRINL